MKHERLRILTGILGETKVNKIYGSDEKLKASEIPQSGIIFRWYHHGIIGIIGIISIFDLILNQIEFNTFLMICQTLCHVLK